MGKEEDGSDGEAVMVVERISPLAKGSSVRSIAGSSRAGAMKNTASSFAK
jgi:hypothetical protein